MFYSINSFISSVIWGPPMLAVFLGTGPFLSVKTGFFQIFGVGRWMNLTIVDAIRKRKEPPKNDGSVSQFAALTSALAACLGTGNIAGVATALCAGGAGAVFWMWVSAILGMMTCCCENILGIKYRIRNSLGQLVGGPMLYIERGMKKPRLAKIYAFLLIGASLGMGNMTQANSVAAGLESFGVSPALTAAILTPLIFICISGGLKRISAVAEKLIPLLSIVFIGACVTVIAKNIGSVIPCFRMIIRDAFSPKAVTGFGIAKAARYGISRGVFSNEAGLGSNTVIHASADCELPAVQGMWGIFEVMFDTLFMCTITAVTILSSGVWSASGSPDGIALCAAAFESVMGKAGGGILGICICLFAFATLVAWSYYGKSGAAYLFGDKSGKYYNIIYAIATCFGCVMKLGFVWSISDIFNGLLAIPNIYALIKLSDVAIESINKEKSPRKIRGHKACYYL
ncbi:MAG: sodium:alanine symporter family protein [Clostridia bacterium]|nr:sodium:alanine symporter family protein [Clostridia bacterium]